MNGKLGDEGLGEFKLGDALLAAVPPSPGGGMLIGGRLPIHGDRLLEDYDEDVALAFVLTQV